MRESASNRSLLACAAVVCVLTASISHSGYQASAPKKPSPPDPTTLKYFPQSAAGEIPFIAEFLNSTDEPSLLARVQDPTAVSYRFDTWELPGLNFLVIRFSLNSDGTATVVKFLVPRAANPLTAGSPNRVEESVSAADTAKFLQLVDEAGFWAMPTVQPPSPTPPKYYVFDGAFWVFEGVRDGAYHVVYRLNPNASPFTEMVRFLGKDLAGLNEREVPRGIWPPINSSPNRPVTIQVSGPVTAEQPFAVRVINERSKLISFCVASAGTIVAWPQQPVPAFDVQRPGPKKWGSLFWGSDMGPFYEPTELGSEKSQEFFMKLSEPGRYRLRLYYVPRSLPTSPGLDICAKLDELKGAKVITSEEFEVLLRN